MYQLLRTLFLIFAIIIAGTQVANATDPEEPANRIDILDKLANHYYLDFKPFVKIELPRILYTESGVHFFISTTAAISPGTGFTDAYYLQNPQPPGHSLKPVTYKIVNTNGDVPKIDFSLSSHLIWFWFSFGLVFFLFRKMVSMYKQGIGRLSAPRGSFQNLFETLVIFIRDEVALANIGPKRFYRYSPYLLSCFFMILFMNLFGLLPWGVTPTADISVTLVFALTTFIITQFNGSRDHWKHVFAMPGVPKFMLIIMTPVEILGLLTKPFALMVRLFANMVSGKMLIYSILGMIFIFGDLFGAYVGIGSAGIWIPFNLFIYALKIFAALLQAYIFTMFSALFIGMATEEHEHHQEAEHAH